MNAVYSFIELGGPVVALLALVSVVSLAVILLKICQYWRSRVGSRARADQAVRLWKSGQQAEAISHAVAGRSLAAAVVAQAMRFKVLGLDRERIEEHLSRIVAERLHDLQSGFRFLDVVAQTAPLLGLFGTVLGMIEAFRELQSAGSAVDPSVLAGGIWVALLTTAAGLAVAMPVSLFLTWLESRLESERVNAETLVSDVLSDVPADIHPDVRTAGASGNFRMSGEPARAV